jgi:hypothetical protein
VARLAAPKTWFGRTEADDVGHEDHPVDTRPAETRTVDRDREATHDRDTYTHSAKIDEATEKAADAIRDAAARAASDRAHARARTSALASIGLVLAVIAALAVATGVLAVLGVGIGIVALLFAIGGLSATGRRYRFISGRGEAVAGVLLASAAIVIGVLAITGALSGLDTDTNQVERLADWLPSWLS